MKSKWRGKRGWLGKLFCGGALGLSGASESLQAQTLPDSKSPVEAVSPGTQLPPANPVDPNPPPNSLTTIPGLENLDPLAPAWVDPVSRVPNLFGGFFATSLQATQAGTTYQTFLPGKTVTTPLHLTGVGAEGNTGTQIIPLSTAAAAKPAIPSNVIMVNGPGGPYILTSIIPVSNPHSLNTVPLTQNAELTNLVHAKYPSATFVDGSVTFTNLFSFNAPANFYYDYLATSTTPPQVINHTTPQLTASLPNPAGGGLVGRNLYFENGTAMPQDRVYFFNNYVGNFQVPGNSLGINSFVFGAEKTFFDGRMSVELRVPFAGTANRDQSADQGFSVDQVEFGNIGLAVKGVVYRTPNFLASVGLGFSLPTAGTSQMSVAGTPILDILNRTCLLQPLLGLAWAPNDRFYAQAGLQFDLDPIGNQVKGLNTSGGLSNIGVLHDPGYSYLNAATGYWLYRGNAGIFTGLAVQSELDYYASLGRQNAVQSGGLTVTDSSSSINVLNFTPGAIFEFGSRTRLSLGVSFPITGDRLYSWNLITQFNFNF
jgi:hypothetical protein